MHTRVIETFKDLQVCRLLERWIRENCLKTLESELWELENAILRLLEVEFGPAAVFLFPRPTSPPQCCWPPIVFRIVKKNFKNLIWKLLSKNCELPLEKIQAHTLPKCARKVSHKTSIKRKKLFWADSVKTCSNLPHDVSHPRRNYHWTEDCCPA